LQPFLLDMTPTSPDWWISLPIDYEHTVLLGGKPGDINYDDAVTPRDAQLVEAYRTGTTALTDFQQKKADVNQDGVVTVTDTQCIFDNSLGKPSCLDQSTQVQSWPVFRSEDFGMQLGPVLNVASSSITFSVNLFAPQCVRRVPRVAPFAGDYFAGGQISISFFISNNDGFACGPSNFVVENIIYPASWSLAGNGGQLSIDPIPVRDIMAIQLTVPSSTPLGEYKVSFQVKNVSSGMATTKTVPVRIIGSQ
ncbi:MAG: hypothetical protein G01um101448_335, partial [Parcubacteria group bacterium Gr01-1014_48]